MLCNLCFQQLAIEAWDNFMRRMINTTLIVSEYEYDTDTNSVVFSYIATSKALPNAARFYDTDSDRCMACNGTITDSSPVPIAATAAS